MKSHKDLDVWNESLDLATWVYEVTNQFPNEERFGLVGQMRRAAVSIASNIAEGAGRQTDKEFIHFLYVASGSASELDTQLEISRRSGMASRVGREELQTRREKVSRMLHGLIRSVKSRPDSQPLG